MPRHFELPGTLSFFSCSSQLNRVWICPAHRSQAKQAQGTYPLQSLPVLLLTYKPFLHPTSPQNDQWFVLASGIRRLPRQYCLARVHAVLLSAPFHARCHIQAPYYIINPSRVLTVLGPEKHARNFWRGKSPRVSIRNHPIEAIQSTLSACRDMPSGETQP